MKQEKPKQKTTYLYPKEIRLIEEASDIIGLSDSAFIRSCAIKESRKILMENKQEVSQ